ncbi:BREX-2 system phosphatase PglZ [Saccharopolyspora sp. NPDC050642]|uniref:BREX-2 system phosphatase PglZ n=1 Tax=Saccharopolyspora sp. NPDC050642 TaxID=3157099 RepID=UPI0033FF0ADE
MSAPPAVDHRVIDALVQGLLPHASGRRLLLVYARYDDSVDTFVAGGVQRRRVHVVDQHSVLGMVEAWQQHLRAHAEDDDLLVLTTSVPEEQLGWDLRAYAILRSIRNVDRARIVAHRFGAVDVDQRMRREDWLIDALLDAEPAEGWQRSGSVLTRDRALRALIGARLNRPAAGDGMLDAGTLLEWSRGGDAVRFEQLAQAERDGLSQWLTETVGDAAKVLTRLVADGRAADAMPLGVVASAAIGPNASLDAGLALGGLLGGAHGGELRAFTEAVAGTLERWVHEAATSRNWETAHKRVVQVVQRADEIASAAGLTESLGHNRFLPSAFISRLHALAAALPTGSNRAKVSDAERALASVRDHAMARLQPGRVRAAEMAVRLARWLARPAGATTAVAAAVELQLADTAWADRALNVLWHGDPGGDPVVGQAYRSLWEASQARRNGLDEAFAQRLAVWSTHASTIESSGCLLVEQVLAEIAAPLAKKTAPLVIVLDGMSGAVATGLGEELIDKSWLEVSRTAGQRIAAVAAIPSVTRVSRASLLAGTVTAGEQSTEKEGFQAFWRKRRRAARLFHKADIGGGAGKLFSDELHTALAEPGTVVGVVLNTIDDALDHGQEGDRAEWAVDKITYLPALLDAARSHQRPVVLVSDHGHVLDRGMENPTPASGVESARWRTGEPSTGEVALSGPRVVYGDGTLVAPWRENIRYTPRKAGYHGGASLAEMTVPVLVLLPTLEQLPSDWHVLPRESSEPGWWESRGPRAAALPVPEPPVKSRKVKASENVDALFPVDPPVEESLGNKVVNSPAYKEQRNFAPRGPDRRAVAAVIDALAAQPDHLLTTSAVADAAGRAARQPEFFVTALERLLNIDGYPIVSRVDGRTRVKLDVETLRLQFGVGTK